MISKGEHLPSFNMLQQQHHSLACFRTSSPRRPPRGTNTVKKGFVAFASVIFDIKNYGRNGPEGQFMTASTTMCNAGSPPYGSVFLSSEQSTKVSMKEKKRGKENPKKRGGEALAK